MPDNATIVAAWLKTQRGQYFCAQCVSRATGVAPLAQVNQIVRPLEHSPVHRYMQTTCSACSLDRKCVGFFG